jgi:hypothetical protein
MTRVKSASVKQEMMQTTEPTISGKCNPGERSQEPAPLIDLKRDLPHDLRNLAEGRENRQNHRST